MGNLSNNNGQSSSPNSDNNGGDGDPKKEEYESQIKDLQEVEISFGVVLKKFLDYNS